jgi:uncharacterized protein
VETRVVDNHEAQRFEISVGDEVAGYAEYDVRDGVMVLPHVVVQPRFEGRGLGSELTRAALEAAREQGLGVLPYCSFVRTYIRRHQGEHLELVPADKRSAFGLDTRLSA